MTQTHSLPGVIRPLLPEERGTFASLLRRLDGNSRRRRFGIEVDDGFIDSHARRIDWDRAFVLGYFEGGALRGAVEAAWPAVDWLDGAAEIAVQVEAGWRRRGVAGALLTAATRLARARGIAGIFFSALAENEPLRRLIGGFGIPFALVGAEIEGRMELNNLSHPSPRT
ncbi:MAG: GNAT family N-acetyltransferase [Alphaproteobacteria bacterium]